MSVGVMTPSEQDPSDAAVMTGVAAGDEGAVRALLARQWDRACRTALAVLGDPGRAEDAAQEAFVAAIRAAPRFDPSRPVGPWLARLVVNAARMQRRAGGRRRRHEERVPPAAAGRSGPESVEAEERARLVRAGLADLSEAQREALVLRYFEGLSLAETAAALGCPEGTVSSRVRRGLGALRDALEPALALSVDGLGLLLAESLGGAPAPAAPAAGRLLADAREPDRVDAPEAPPAAAGPAPGRRPAGAVALAASVAAVAGLAAVVALLASAPPDLDRRDAVAGASPAAERPETVAATDPAPPPGSVPPAADAPAGDAPPAGPPGDRRGRIGLAGSPAPAETEVVLRRGDEEVARVPVDAGGRFRIPADAPAGAELRVEVAGLQAAFAGAGAAAGLALPLSEVDRALELELVPFRLTGEVLAAESGDPVPGATIAWRGQRADVGPLGRFDATLAQTFALGALLSADAPGRATGVATLFGYADAASLEEPRPIRLDGITLRLGPGLAVRGRVVDPSGRGLAGWEVVARAMLPDQADLGGDPSGVGMHSGFAWRAETGPDGGFVLAGLPPVRAGATAAVLDAVEARPLDVEELVAFGGTITRRDLRVDAGEALELVAGRRARIRGRVVGPDGAPVAGARVRPLSGAGGGDDRFSVALDLEGGPPSVGDALLDRPGSLAGGGGTVVFGQDDDQLAVTGADGWFGFQGLPAPLELVVGGVPGLAEARRRVTAPFDEAVVVELERAAPIAGRVLRTDGGVLPGALVTAYPEGTFAAVAGTPLIREAAAGPIVAPATVAEAILADPVAVPEPVAAAISDAHGAFALTTVAPDAYDVAVSSATTYLAGPEHRAVAAVEAFPAVTAGTTLPDVAFEPLPQARLAVRAVPAEGEGPLDPRVRVFAADDASSLRRWSWDGAPDGAGGWIVGGVGPARVEVRAAGRAARVVDVELDPAALAVPPPVVLEPAAPVALELVLPAEDLERLDLYAVDSATGLPRKVSVSLAGPVARLRIDHLAPGPVELRPVGRRGDAELVPYAPFTVEAPTPPDAPPRIELRPR